MYKFETNVEKEHNIKIVFFFFLNERSDCKAIIILEQKGD